MLSGAEVCEVPERAVKSAEIGLVAGEQGNYRWGNSLVRLVFPRAFLPTGDPTWPRQPIIGFRER